MYESLKENLLHIMRVPPEPLDPMGDVASLRVFRAAPGYLKYITLTWAVAQGILFIIALVLLVIFFVAALHMGPARIFVFAAEVVVIGILLAQALISYYLMRLHYEMRWYKVTDRSLRIREGVWSVHEMTLTFANIQNITVTQGPLERIFGIANVRVETAGGGGAQARGPHGEQLGPNLHLGIFRGVDNADEIRDLVLERLRRLRDAGLGDVDDRHATKPAAAVTAIFSSSQEVTDLLAALRDEARALRITAES